ncbi:MAG: polysaccharide deacetylase family protein [Anaerolineales bacterium]|nr:polysaccharide deacetylase family protein [Anaerolineales bacterium]
MNPLSVALKGKGVLTLARRGVSLVSRYGLTAARLDGELRRLADLTEQYGCRATLPITTVVLRRHAALIRAYAARGVEFAMHGYQHVDHSQLDEAAQTAQLGAARRVFEQAGLPLRGFRAPYLRNNAATLAVLRGLGLTYDASPAHAWEVLDGPETPAYRHVKEFFHARSAERYPVVPHVADGLVRLPYSLPDDESLVERLALTGAAPMRRLWLAILQRAYALGELFVIGLHPERTTLCFEALRAVLGEARGLQPAVWIARLDEIADWWRARAAAVVTLTAAGEGAYRVTASGPAGLTVLTRAVELQTEAAEWADGWRRAAGLSFELRAARRPCLGAAPQTAPALLDFLRQQGYVVEVAAERERYGLYLDRPSFSAEAQRPLLAEIEAAAVPLVRLGRWPAGARSALAVTGDIDALTVWDYGLRLIER